MADHQEFVELALELINEEGRTVAFQKLSKAATDPDKPWKGLGVPTVTETQFTKAVFLPATAGMGTNITSEENLKRVNKICLVPPGEKDFSEFDSILDIDSQRWKIEWIDVVQPAEQIVLYVVGVKR